MDASWWEGGKEVPAGRAFRPRTLNTPLDRMLRRSSGRRSQTLQAQKRGRYTRSRPSNDSADDLAFDATLRAAAPLQRERASLREQRRMALVVRPRDYMRKVRVSKSANLILFVVDASWSMAVSERMEATKGAILSLLKDAYQKRDRVGLIVFQKDRATLALAPTNSIKQAKEALESLPIGGKTPLSAGLAMALDVVSRERLSHPDTNPILVVITDGGGNVAMGNMAPREEAAAIAEEISRQRIHALVINMEHAAFDRGLAEDLALHLHGPCYTLEDLKAENLYRLVRQEVQGLPVGQSTAGIKGSRSR